MEIEFDYKIGEWNKGEKEYSETIWYGKYHWIKY